MAHRKTSKRSKAKAMLRLADLEQSKNAVLHSLGAASSQESYGHAIDEFMGWYCSEPRLHLTELSSFATCPLFCHLAGGEQIQFLLGHASRKSRLGLLPPSRLELSRFAADAFACC